MTHRGATVAPMPDDEYRDELLKFIERKAQAGKTVPAPPGPSKSRPMAAPTDIMGLLKKSLAKGGR